MNSPNYITTLITLAVMSFLFWIVWHKTRSILLASVSVEVINTYSIVIYLTSWWLGLSGKPLTPIWITVLIFIAPLVLIPLKYRFNELPKSNTKQKEI